MSSTQIIPGIDENVGAIGFGTWRMNGFHWTDLEDQSLEISLEKSLEEGVRLIDTAPVYGFGRAEEVIGRVMRRLGQRQNVVLATKFGLEWNDNFSEVRRNSTKKQLMRELDKSRRRLQTDVIDLYQVHWPDASTAIGETMDTLTSFFDAGIIRAIGLCNFSIEQIEEARRYGPVHAIQVPLNLFEQASLNDLVPYCHKLGLAVLAYSPLCRGLLGGQYNNNSVFGMNDIRSVDSKFQGELLQRHLRAIQALEEFSAVKQCSLAQLALAWVFQSAGVCAALVGASTDAQVVQNAQARTVQLSIEDYQVMKDIIDRYIPSAKNAAPSKPAF